MLDPSPALHRRPRAPIIVVVFLLNALVQNWTISGAPTTDGLFATINITRGGTGIGEFTCKLEFEKVPRTVANFVGLAEGTLPFVDFQKGHIVQRPFYDGLRFHRVVREPTPFVIQGGSPNGLGTDGPGYTFPDEFDVTLRHDRAGILSMANSGLHSNGSQFFVTLAATPGLDDVHSVFGTVVEGMATLNSVQQGDIIESVVILRNGSAAMNFDVTTEGLPTLADANPLLTKTDTTTTLSYSQLANSEVFVFLGDTVSDWFPLGSQEMHGPNPTNAPRDVTSTTTGKSKQFYSVARVDYPTTIFTPPNVIGKRVILNDGSGFTLTLSLNDASSGTYVYQNGGQTLGPYQINSYVWNQEAYRGHFMGDIFNNPGFGFGDGPVASANISFVFRDPSSGICKGHLVNTQQQRLLLNATFQVEGLE